MDDINISIRANQVVHDEEKTVVFCLFETF